MPTDSPKGKNQATPQTEYWAEYWRARLTNFPDPRTLSLSGPHVLLMEIHDEALNNKLGNERVKNHYLSEIRHWKKNKSKFLNPFLMAVFQNLDSALAAEPSALVAEVCRQALEELERGSYFDFLLEQLSPILLNEFEPKEKDYDRLRTFSDLLAIEFLLHEISSKTCGEIPSRILHQYWFTPGQPQLMSTYPAMTSAKDYKSSGVLDDAAYEKALKAELDALTLQDRLKTMSRLFHEPKKPIRFIFPLKSVKGDKEITIGDVSIYPPHLKQYADSASSLRADEEQFGRDPKYTYTNAATVIDTRDYTYSHGRALSKVNAALDLIYFFTNADGKPSVDPSNWMALNESGVPLTSTMTADKTSPDWVWSEAVSISEWNSPSEEKAISDLGKKLINPSEALHGPWQDLSTALHWQRKANNEGNEEDKLVGYWVTLEKLFAEAERQLGSSKITVISSLLPSIVLRKSFYSQAWSLHRFLRKLIEFKQFTLSPELIKKAKLSFVPGQTLSLSDFLSILPEASAAASSKLLKDQIEFVHKFYTDPKTCAKRLEEELKEMETNLLLIYRYRNKVVHDAHHDDRLLPYYLRRVEHYSMAMVSYLLGRLPKSEVPIIQIALHEKARLDRAIELMKTDPKSNVLDLMAQD